MEREHVVGLDYLVDRGALAERFFAVKVFSHL
jgi:hypothetical protein